HPPIEGIPSLLRACVCVNLASTWYGAVLVAEVEHDHRLEGDRCGRFRRCTAPRIDSPDAANPHTVRTTDHGRGGVPAAGRRIEVGPSRRRAARLPGGLASVCGDLAFVASDV